MVFRKDRFQIWLPRIMGGLLTLSYLLMIFGICRMQVIPLKYLFLIIPLTAIPIGALAYPLLTKKIKSNPKLVTLVGFSFALAALCLWVYSATNVTFSFLSGLGQGQGTIQYSLVARKDRHVTLAHNPATGLMTAETNSDVKTEANKLTKTTYYAYPDTAHLLSATEHTVSSAIIQSSQLNLLKDESPAIYDSLEVLATFTVHRSVEATTHDTTKPFIVYISGIDTYGDLATVSRSDVNILAVVNPQTGKILLVTTPRDYYVQLHGTSGVKDKLTHAGIYGVGMSERTLEDLYEIDIDYYVRLNFASLLKVVDTLGGVEVYSDHTFSAGGYNYTKGWQHMDGAKALAFSRERYAFADGDRTRGKNQERVIEAIVDKLTSPSVLANYRGVLAAIGDSIQTNASSTDLTDFMRQQLDSPRKWQVNGISVDGTGSMSPTYSGGSTPLYVMIPNETSVAKAHKQIHATLGE